MTTPVYPAYAGAWDTQRLALIEIASAGTAVQSQRAITLLARELTARYWCSVWDANPWSAQHQVSAHFAFRAIGVPPGEDPTEFVPGSSPPRRKYAHSTEAGASLARYFDVYGAPGGPQFPGGYVLRCISETLEDGTVHTYPAPPRDPAIWSSVMAEITPLAAALIAEVTP